MIRIFAKINAEWYKKILIGLIFLFLLPTTSFAKDKPQVVFINQVRGEECCAAGSFDNLKKQIETFIEYGISAFFTLRYDAITDKQYTDYLEEQVGKYPNLIKIGLMIEITPKLAIDSGVRYHDIVERWYEAQNAFTIGYESKDRKKIIDRLVRTHKEVFGQNPELTSGWMIDTESLNYLHNRYGIKAHQITREQWGTDSYTLYGGPPHYPYPASKNWLFIPDFDEKNPVLILRQTVTDPLYNYGETEKSYTSQPNDYMSVGLDFNYFKALVDQALFGQKDTGFVLLGLENSMDKKYQDEYLKQLEYISRQKQRVKIPLLDEMIAFWKKKKITSYRGRDLIKKTANKVEFITSENSRVRKRIVNGKSYVTDYRYYDNLLEDPYKDYTAKKHGYWIAPYAIDYSHIYNPETIFPITRNDIKVDDLPKLKLKKFNAVKFNKTKFDDYPYFMPEAIEREIDRKKSRIKTTIGGYIEIEFFARDKFGYPANISPPLEIKSDPKIEGIIYNHDSAKHFFSIPNIKENVVDIVLISNKKQVKRLILFPKHLPFLKLVW